MNDYILNQYNNFCGESRDHSKCHVLCTFYFFCFLSVVTVFVFSQ